MSTRHSAPSFAKDPLSGIYSLLSRLTMAALHLQVRAGFQADRPELPTSRAGAMARAAADGQASLRAMSHYCIEQIMPRVQALMLQVDAAAELAGALAEDGPDAGLAMQLNSIAINLERARGSSRGRARAPQHGAGMIRLSEQRLWGALAVELQRLEGADGPMSRACAEVEAVAAELAAAIEAFLERDAGMALAQRHDLTHVLVRLEDQAATEPLSREQVAGQLGDAAIRLPELPGLCARLSAAYRPLRAARPDLVTVLSIATQTSTQSGVTQRLEQAMQDLDRLLGGLAPDYRTLARTAERPQRRAVAQERIAADAPIWQDAASLLAAPLALVPEALAACASIALGKHAGREGQNLFGA